MGLVSPQLYQSKSCNHILHLLLSVFTIRARLERFSVILTTVVCLTMIASTARSSDGKADLSDLGDTELEEAAQVDAQEYFASHKHISNLQIVVRDLRADRGNSDALISAIQSQVLNSLSGGATARNHFKLTVDVIEHRSFFYTRKLERLDPF